jgi:hypothetical protein
VGGTETNFLTVPCETISEPAFLTFMEPRNRFQGMDSASLCSLAGQYDNPIPTRFLAPIECLKIPDQLAHAQAVNAMITESFLVSSLWLVSKQMD